MNGVGMNLNPREARCLALRIAMTYLVDSDRWLEWEDYPWLGEHAFQRLDESVRTEAVAVLKDELRLNEIAWNIDSAALLENAIREELDD